TSAADPEALRNATRLAEQLREDERKLRVRRPQASEFERRAVPASLAGPEDRAVSIGFYSSWGANSYPAFKRAPPHLHLINPSWLSLSGPDMSLKASVDDRVLSTVQASKPKVAILPMIQNVAGGEWDGKGLAKFLADPAARAVRIAEIVDFIGKYKFQGV